MRGGNGEWRAPSPSSTAWADDVVIPAKARAMNVER
jgi:hypothetical protein